MSGSPNASCTVADRGWRRSAGLRPRRRLARPGSLRHASIRPYRCTSPSAFFGPIPLTPSLKSVPTRIARSISPSRVMRHRSRACAARSSPPARSAGTCPGSGEIPCRRSSGTARAGRAEQQRVVVLARGGPHGPAGHVRGLRLALGRRLHGREAEQAQQLAGLATISRDRRDVIVAFE